ncbi:response regulator [Salisediminibacterium halotolerans]|uniref:response regulator n=1 Tax=Salisediminibacterium halotolerans TaxID=517425 RepID=UPI000EACEA14|nr:response regulator transcription factor [Salisediminibacterium halotolerans]RLJ75521.1 LuxR family two component transcriptional regulator [Actinophytocola xinjiangensis]RPE89374.1 LuxR family two component transcriptional regulator [Salisediminibacterium halotolerans]TWG36134.1 LuxR family two component transcriptional regulator [Salisediminibacterium halotolerans]GEL08136.1 DNA-binding response regulator [Salisediminibacterium halotolerans]
MINVLVVDDHALIRRGIVMLLEAYDDIAVVGEASDGEEAMYLTAANHPDVILLDISMPEGLDGLTAAERIKKEFPDKKIIFLSMHDEEVYVKKAAELQAEGFILKKSDRSDMYEAIKQVLSGKKYYKVGLSDDQLARLFQNSGKHFSVLSMREKEIVHLTVLGYTNKQIAERLVISPKTVETHKTNIMNKLELSNKSELIQYGIKNLNVI